MAETVNSGGLKKFVYTKEYQPELKSENEKYKLTLIPKENKKIKFYLTIDWEWGLHGEKNCKLDNFSFKDKFEKKFLGKEKYIITIKKRNFLFFKEEVYHKEIDLMRNTKIVFDGKNRI